MKVDGYGKIEMTYTEAAALYSLVDVNKVDQLSMFVLDQFKQLLPEAQWRSSDEMRLLHEQTLHAAKGWVPTPLYVEPMCLAPCPPDASLGFCQRPESHEGDHWTDDPSGAPDAAWRWEQWTVPEHAHHHIHKHAESGHTH